MKNLIYLFCFLKICVPLFSDYDYNGKWVGDFGYRQFYNDSNIGLDTNRIFLLQQDIENRQFIIIDTNYILYRISIDNGKTISSVEISKTLLT